MKQSKRFSVTITYQDKQALREQARQYGYPYGVFFDTAGKAHIERINPATQYGYVWRTDESEGLCHWARREGVRV